MKALSNILIVFILMFVVSDIAAQTDKYFTQIMDYTHTDEAIGIVEIDGGYLVGGQGINLTEFIGQGIYLHIDNEGNILNEQVLNDSLNCSYSDVSSYSGQFVMSGRVKENEEFISRLIFWQGDTLIADNSYSNYENEKSNLLGIVHYNAQEIYSVGFVQIDVSEPEGYMYLLKTDSLGNKLWDTLYTHHERSRLTTIAKAENEPAFYVGGIIDDYNSISNQSGEGIVMKVDTSGTILWEQIYDYGQREIVSEIIECSDNGILIGFGNTDPNNRGVMKLDSLGNIEWENLQIFQGGFWTALIEDSEGNFIVSGTALAEGQGNKSFGQITKLNSIGEHLWTRYFGLADDDDYFYDLIQEEDGSLVACGRTESNGIYGADMWIVKMNCLGLQTEPEANFSYESNNTEVFFENLSQYIYPDSIDGGHYLWNFGDGNVSTEESPTHTYSESNTYEVSLTAVVCQDTAIYTTCLYLDENALCCADVEELPVVAFSDSPLDDSLNIAFTNQSQNLYEEYNNGASFLWDFGDGSSSSEFSPSHSYTNAGVYEVSLSLLFCNDTSVLEYSLLVGDTTQTAIHRLDLLSSIQVYPNPSSGAISFSFAPNPKERILHLYDSTGKLLRELTLPTMSEGKDLFLGDWSKGVYFWQLGKESGKILLE